VWLGENIWWAACLQCPKPLWPSHRYRRSSGAFVLPLPASSGTGSLPVGGSWEEATSLGRGPEYIHARVCVCTSAAAACMPLLPPWSWALSVTTVRLVRWGLSAGLLRSDAFVPLSSCQSSPAAAVLPQPRR
jgi:hypothetical protein